MSIRFGAFFRQPPSSGTGCRSIAIFGHWAKCKKAHRQNPPRPKPRPRRATRLTVKSSHMTPSGFPATRLTVKSSHMTPSGFPDILATL
jgi:hypothetical protein